ncbi:MAG TPA: SAM-dependent methyltransferase, partial [Burkholderiaceae bacterium]
TDRDAQALAQIAGEGVATLAWDFEAPRMAWPFARDRFAGIVMTNYLHRPLFPHMLASLAPGGILIAETFAAGNAAFGKPSNPDFLLQSAELLALLRDHAPNGHSMRVIAFEDGYTDAPKAAMVQRICAIKLLDKDKSSVAPSQLHLDGWQAGNKL